MHRLILCNQNDSYDCGAACLRMIAKYYGKNYTLASLRKSSYISRKGASLMGISDAAEKIGFTSTGVRLSLQRLEKALLPCILHWEQNHYVVLYKIKKKKNNALFYIADPAASKSVLTEEDFRSHWVSTKSNGTELGVALLLQPGVNFYSREDETDKGRSLSFFLRYLHPYKLQIFQILTCMVSYMLLGLAVPFLTQSIVDIGIRNSDLNFITLILVAQLVLMLTEMGVHFMHGWIALHMNTRIDIAMLSDFWCKLMSLPIRFFDTKATGDIMQRLGDHGRIRHFLINDSVGILFSAVSFFVYTVLLGYYNLGILLLFMVGHALYVAWITSFLKYRKKLDYKSFGLQAKDRSKVIQLVQGMQEIKLCNDEKRQRWEWEDIQAQLMKNNIYGLKIDQIRTFGGNVITRSASLLVSFLIARQVIDGNMTLGMMMALSYIMGQVSAPVSRFIDFIHSLQNAKISLERINEIHSIEDEYEGTAEKVDEIPVDGDITLSNLSFSYSGSPREYVLKDINLVIPSHKATAIVGVSGSGKTTIIKLLQGFYNPQEGEVKIGRTTLQNINPRFWRSEVGSVMQDGYIFSDTIARNIAVGDETIDKGRLIESSKIANIYDFITSLPLGFNTKIGMEGNGISQGQRQRILIARAVYKNPNYMFFDEATNSLDTKNEKTIMENLFKFYNGRTVVVCAHRLSTIKNADKIVVLKSGRIVETGTHATLLKARGEYFRLVEGQLEMLRQ